MSQEEIQIPKGWELKKLSEVCTNITSGGTPSRENPSYFDGDIPWIKIGDLNNSEVFDSKEKITLEGVKNSSAKLFPKDTVLFAMYGGQSYLSGITGIAKMICTTNQAICGLECSKKLDPYFLLYFLQAKMDEIRKLATGGAQLNLNQNKIKNFQISLPTIIIQQKIVQKLDHILGQLEEKKKQILELNTTEKLTFFLESNKFLSLQLIKTGFFAKEDWKNYPKIKLGKITKITSGSTPSRDNPEYWNGEIPWLKSGELLDGDINDSAEHITKKGLSNSSAKLFPKDTILVALYGQGKTRGKTGRLLIESSTNQAVCGIFPNSNFLSEYVQFWIRSMYLELRKTAVGGAQPNWNTTTIKEIEITLPPLEEQKKIVMKIKKKLLENNNFEKRIKDIMEQKNRNLKYIDRIQLSIFDSAFSGKLVN